MGGTKPDLAEGSGLTRQPLSGQSTDQNTRLDARSCKPGASALFFCEEFMRIPLINCLVLALLATGASGQDVGRLEGTWEIISLIDNGQLVGSQSIKEQFASDSKLVFRKNTITVNNPGKKQQVAYVIDSTVPGTIDLAGVEKLGSKGIYALNGDILTLCFGPPESSQRPTSFTSGVGGQRLMVVLHKVTPPAALPVSLPANTGTETIIGPNGSVTTVAAGSTIVVLQPQSSPSPAPTMPTPPAPVVRSIPFLPTAAAPVFTREQIIGTWGHQDNERIETITFNPDNSFSGSITWKPGFLRTFRQPEKHSGTWLLTDKTITLRITASTDAKHENNQVLSMRLDRINEYEMLFLDQEGKNRIEWKVR